MQAANEWEGRALRLILADDHAIVREGIGAYLKQHLRIDIVAECSNGEEALHGILDLNPDLAILDLQMARLPGLEVVRRVRQAQSAAKLIVFSIVRDEPLIGELLRSGADAYLLKETPAPELLEAVQTVLSGGQYLSPGLRRVSESGKSAGPDPLVVLSKREYEVFTLLVDGVRPRDIARQLEISPKTVDTYRANILRKLEVEGIAGLIRFAIQRGGTTTSQAV